MFQVGESNAFIWIRIKTVCKFLIMGIFCAILIKIYKYLQFYVIFCVILIKRNLYYYICAILIKIYKYLSSYVVLCEPM